MCPHPIVTIGVVAIGAVFAVPSTQAYPTFMRAYPPVGSTVARSPIKVQIEMSQELYPSGAFVRVVSADGREVYSGRGYVSSSDPDVLETRIRAPLPPGRYRVFWRACAAGCYYGSEPPMTARYQFVVAPSRAGPRRDSTSPTPTP